MLKKYINNKAVLSIATILLSISMRTISTAKSLYDQLGEAELITPMTEEELNEEIKLGEMELLAQLVQAEAGNQGVEGMRLVAEVVINRVNDPRFPDTVEEVIFQPGQFSVIINGTFDEAAWNMSSEAYKAIELAWDNCKTDWLYFNNQIGPLNSSYQYKEHWFGR